MPFINKRSSHKNVVRRPIIKKFAVDMMKYLLTRHFNFSSFTKLSEAYGIRRRRGKRDCLGRSRGLNFIDSTPIKVCQNRGIHNHKVFTAVAERWQRWLGWFCGFKLHLIINDKGEIQKLTVLYNCHIITWKIPCTVNKNKKQKSSKNIFPDFQELICGILTMCLICLFLPNDRNRTGDFRDRF